DEFTLLVLKNNQRRLRNIEDSRNFQFHQEIEASGNFQFLSIATPLSIVESLGFGRKVLCPVPVVIGLDEPSVVPNFLEALSLNDWIPVKVSAYETKWAGADCAAPLLERLRMEGLDAIVFTSTAEVQGLVVSKELWKLLCLNRDINNRDRFIANVHWAVRAQEKA
ncbi:hypothetical protein FRX31_002126, partial [Thalictrum thalictroides]